MTALAETRGWKRNALAFALGICATLTLAPFFYFPLLIPAFAGLYLLVQASPSRRRAFWDGWWWGWGFYITGLYWFCIALLTDPDKFAWLIPFALFGLTGVIALYSGVACWIFARLPVRGLSGIFVFAVVWTVIEYARGHLFTGFPWNLPGYSFGFSDTSLQLASLVNVYGLTFFAVLLGGSLAGLKERRGWLFIAAVWALFVAGMGWGAWRLHEADRVPEAERTVPGVALRLVQADISQPHKWDPKLQMHGLREHIRLTQSAGLDNVTHVVWPETATPYILSVREPLTHILGNSIPPGEILITGALRAEGTSENWQVWNSLVALSHEGGIVGSYDKIKLVPFGEFLPFRNLLPKAWLTPVGDKDFSSGRQGQVLEWPGLPPLIPLICYEAIFPEMATDPSHRAQLLLNVTNDAWFGLSSGPHQHFEMARMRAVEQGIPLVRVANTGITAVVDPFGRVLASLPLGTQGVLDARLPRAENRYTTYTGYSNIFLLILVITGTILTIRQGKPYKN
ncbi:MAG: apolipoprotein N-acyltransferase [Pseudomonadota bacterium]|nr:apolipoprotein N-acyltransferase [Pseudomonadota bacterium]